MIQNLPDGYETNLGVSGGSLSGGQRQRVGLARAVFGSPKLVVLDEPNAHLDSVGEKALLSCIEALKESGATVVLVTHKANLLAVSDKTLMLVDGAVEKFGPTASVFQQQNAEKTAAVNAAAKEDSSVVKLQKT
jgi:ABC-type protease/lipase transport system fused ATPase/permease subunit